MMLVEFNAFPGNISHDGPSGADQHAIGFQGCLNEVYILPPQQQLAQFAMLLQSGTDTCIARGHRFLETDVHRQECAEDIYLHRAPFSSVRSPVSVNVALNFIEASLYHAEPQQQTRMGSNASAIIFPGVTGDCHSIHLQPQLILLTSTNSVQY